MSAHERRMRARTYRSRNDYLEIPFDVQALNLVSIGAVQTGMVKSYATFRQFFELEVCRHRVFMTACRLEYSGVDLRMLFPW